MCKFVHGRTLPSSFSLCFYVYLRLCEQVCLSVLLSAGQCREIEQQRREGRELASKRAKVLITYRSNLADDSLKMRRAAQCTSQKEREKTIYCSKVPRTPISASLNVYYQFLAPEPCLAALLTASLSLPSYPTLLFSLFYSRSTLPAFILSFTFHLCPLTSHFFSPLGIPRSPPESSVNQCLYQSSLCCSICVLNLSVLFYPGCFNTALIVSLFSPSPLSLFLSCSPFPIIFAFHFTTPPPP